MAKIFRKTHNPYVLCAVSHSLTLREWVYYLARTAGVGNLTPWDKNSKRYGVKEKSK